MRAHIRLTVAITLVAATAFSTGCAPHEDWTTPVEAAWSVEARLLSAPLRAGDVVLAYVVGSEGAEEIVAWDTDDGQELWRQTALPGTTPRGVAHVVAAAEIDGTWMVGILAPRHSRHELDDWSRFIVLDAATGVLAYPELRSTRVWGERPFVCADGTAFCTEGFRHEDEHGREIMLQYTPGDEELRPADHTGAPYLDGGFRISTYVSVAEGRLRYGVDGAIAWSRPYEDVFGDGASTGAGWAWYDGSDEDDDHDGEDDGSDGLLIGSGSSYTERDLSVAFAAEAPLDDGTVARLDRATGDTIWSIDGAAPCAITGYRLRISEKTLTLCKYRSGSLSWHWDGHTASEVTYHDVDQQLLGVDPYTGEVLWTRDLGDEPANYASPEEGGTAFPSADESVTAVIDGVAHHIESATGEATPFASDAALLCAAPRDSVQLTSIWKDPIYLTADNYVLCSSDATRAEQGVVSSATLGAAGHDRGETALITTPTGLSAYRLSR